MFENSDRGHKPVASIYSLVAAYHGLVAAAMAYLNRRQVLRAERATSFVWAGSVQMAEVSFGAILLQKSKIERRRKSRQGGFLDAPAAARLSGTDTKVGGCFGMKRCGPSRLCARSASAVFKIFALHPKKTFATISANGRHRRLGLIR
jgi:hypothetical protein